MAIGNSYVQKCQLQSLTGGWSGSVPAQPAIAAGGRSALDNPFGSPSTRPTPALAARKPRPDWGDSAEADVVGTWGKCGRVISHATIQSRPCNNSMSTFGPVDDGCLVGTSAPGRVCQGDGWTFRVDSLPKKPAERRRIRHVAVLDCSFSTDKIYRKSGVAYR